MEGVDTNIHFELGEENYTIAINNGNAAFHEGKLKINLRKCPNLVQALEQQPYDKNGEPDKGQGLDHPNDGLGYFVNWTMPVKKPTIRQEALRQ